MEGEYQKALIYCRVSSEKQVKEGNGLDSQEHRCRKYAASLGLQVESVFRDEGISGGLFDRPAIQSLLKYMDANWQNKYCVIFDDLKRFARDVEVHLRLKSELRAREAQLRCLNYNFDDSAEGEFVETIFAAQNQLERKQNRRQVCQKMKARIEQGYWCFCPPTAYQYEKDKDHGKIIVPINPAARILAEALKAFAENRILEQVDFQNYLVAKDFHKAIKKEARTLTFEFIKGLLKQPLYAGIIDCPKWDIIGKIGKHKAIISIETYRKIQKKLERPERKPRETDRLEFPLRRVITCSICGKNMTGSVSRGKTKYYGHYTCNNKECKAKTKNILYDKLENDYVEFLDKIKVEKEILEIGRLVATRIWEQKQKDTTLSQAAKEEEKREIELAIDEYLDLIPKTKSESVKSRYEAKIEQLDKRLAEINIGPENKKAPDINEALNIAIQFLGTPAQTWKKASLELKNTIHRMIFTENPTYSLETGFGTPKLSLPFYIKQHLNNHTGDMVDWDEKTWNTFIETVLKWEPILREIYCQ